MAADYPWLWDNVNSVWVKAQCDANGKLLISDLDPFTIEQTTPENLRHVPHGYYAVGDTYLPLAVDVNGVLQTSGAGAVALADLTDVDLTSLADGDFIYYDSASGKWKRIAHKDATTGVHGAGASTLATAATLATHAALVTGVHGLALGAKVYHSAAQSIVNTTWTTLAFDSEEFDTDTIHNLSTNNSRLTCKTAGNYIIGAIAEFAINATGTRFSRFKKNGTGSWTLGGNIVPNNGASFGVDMCLAGSDVLAVNDYIELEMYQNSGVALDAGTNCRLWMHRV